jgi:hypothetical protein
VSKTYLLILVAVCKATGGISCCKIDNRLPVEPNITFNDFKNWIDYLSIERKYYEYDRCKNKINQYLIKYPKIRNEYLNLFNICLKMCEIDKLFPSSDLWIEYYNVKKLEDIINFNNIKIKKPSCALIT